MKSFMIVDIQNYYRINVMVVKKILSIYCILVGTPAMYSVGPRLEFWCKDGLLL